ncbi:hypothetical protein LEN26_016150 [Aphanomyces euteiches]|nr:hypothetical protein LEN26_016150 [Aphanomyces euteiches]KAH9102805.1 hypothetical protein AeMF1_020701 [Aphanomyces euteiches]KAH9188675.1 hypothetical protein AeNC1_009351 [Aphanomyces euteiches]
MNQMSMERDDVLMKCMNLAQSLQLTFPTKHHTYDADAYLPHVVQHLVHAQALPVELLPPLSFVTSVCEQLTQSQYVESNVLHTVLYHMHMPPLSAFVRSSSPPPYQQIPAPFHHQHPYHQVPHPYHPHYYGFALPQPYIRPMVNQIEARTPDLHTNHDGNMPPPPFGQQQPHPASSMALRPQFDPTSDHLTYSSSFDLPSVNDRPETNYTFSKDILRQEHSLDDNLADSSADDAAIAWNFQPFLDSLTHDEDDDETIGSLTQASEPQLHIDSCAASVTTSPSDDDRDDDLDETKAAPSPPPKRRSLFDAPTPLEIQKQSVQIHATSDLLPQTDSVDDIKRATSTWIARMHAQGHTFDEKAAQKFHELAAADPYRAVGITVSFDIRKDMIHNKSAWLARACFNCQRKHLPKATTTRKPKAKTL